MNEILLLNIYITSVKQCLRFLCISVSMWFSALTKQCFFVHSKTRALQCFAVLAITQTCHVSSRLEKNKQTVQTTNIVFYQNVFYLHLYSSLELFTFVMPHKIKDVRICSRV